MGRGENKNATSLETSDLHTYTPEEWEFAEAADAYSRDRRRKFLGRSELLHVLLSLGYRKVAPKMAVAEAREMHRRPVLAEAN